MSIKLVFQHNDGSIIMTEDEFYAYAKSYHGLDLKPPKEYYTLSLTAEDTEEKKESPFIIDPLFRKGEFIVMAGQGGIGKTLVSLELTLIVACGDSIGTRLLATKPYKTLRIDTEMRRDDIEERFKKLINNYRHPEMIRKNVRLFSTRDLGKDLDLTKTENQAWVESHIFDSDAQLIVLDNLGDLIPSGGENLGKVWQSVASWIKKLTNSGKTILLVHHETKGGKIRGTQKIIDFADLVISLEKPKNCPEGRTLIDFIILKTRRLDMEQKHPFRLDYVKGDGIIKRYLRPIEPISPHQKLAISQPEKLISEKEKSTYGLSELQIEMLEKARELGGCGYVNAAMFKRPGKIKGRHPNTITGKLNDLCKKGLLEKMGAGKGARYYPIPSRQSDTQPATD